MNVVFMGTPDFAVESLSKIYDAGHNILAVVSQPDKPSGRGMKLLPTPVKEYAISKNLKVKQGKFYEIKLKAENKSLADKEIEALIKSVLINPIVETYEIEKTEEL